ncbi:MAG TPA: hypothetical protein VK324_01290 [Tepidisphaeraceae bacterium]|nr:hypothetical protein [Tepidisphaeraceae bacterium]
MTTTPTSPPTPARAARRHRRGVAVPMVLSAVALAVVLAYAMLAAASTRSTMARNATRAAQLEQLAESGLNYAIHFLRMPDDAGTTGWFQPDTLIIRAAGYTWPTSGGTVTVDAQPALPGTFDLTVTWLGTVATDRTLSDFEIESTGRIGTDARRRTAVVRRKSTFVPQAALSSRRAVELVPGVGLVGAGGAVDLTKPSFWGLSSLTAKSGSSVTGDVWATALANQGAAVFGTRATKSGRFVTPSSGLLIAGQSTIPLLENMSTAAGMTYRFNGAVATAQLISTATLYSTADLPAVDPVTNPGRVYYYPGNLTIRTPPTVTPQDVPPPVAVTGTLIVDGTLSIGHGGELPSQPHVVTVAPVAGMPAVVCRADVQFAGNAKAVTVDGLVHVVSGVFSTLAAGNAAASSLKINGALMIENATTTGFGTTALPLTITHVPAKVDVPAFSTASNQVVTNVAVLEVR